MGVSVKLATFATAAGLGAVFAAVPAGAAPATAPTGAEVTSMARAQAHYAAAARALGATPNAASSFCLRQTMPLDCWVTEPIVNQPSATYPAIQFLAGDHVSISAGGCVQTGGKGRTWKRYVDPASDSDLYHGLIQVPGLFQDPVPIKDVLANGLPVVARDDFLSLGYQDDNYSDNGYWGHDDGTGDQCKGSQNAWVHIVIS